MAAAARPLPDANAALAPDGADRWLQYAVRHGRLTPGLRRDLAGIVPAYEVAADAPLDRAAVFGRAAPLAVEIGTGSGEHVVAHAKRFPELDHVAVELYPPGLVRLARTLRREGLENVRLAFAPAQEAFARMFADGDVDLVHVLFPDPWPKRRHRKRRLISPEFVALLARRMRPGGTFGFASDFGDYVADARRVLENSGMFAAAEPWPARVVPSKYEIRARDGGKSVHAFRCRRTDADLRGATGAN